MTHSPAYVIGFLAGAVLAALCALVDAIDQAIR